MFTQCAAYFTHLLIIHADIPIFINMQGKKWNNYANSCMKKLMEFSSWPEDQSMTCFC